MPRAMSENAAVRYEVTGRIARLTLDRPERGNGINGALVRGLAESVERADLDPAVHVLHLSGEGTGFCGGYDLVESAEGMGAAAGAERSGIGGSPIDPAVITANHDPRGTWDPMVDYAMMSSNVNALHEPVPLRASPSSAWSTDSVWREGPTWRSARTCS